MKRSRIWCVASLLLGCAVETDANGSEADAEPPKLLAQRVTATVKRSATRLVQIETEHETLITTPERPFATLQSGQPQPFRWLDVCLARYMPPLQLASAFGALLLLLGCTAPIEPDRADEEPLPKLLAQRVTATIQREASRLVRLETEHEAFLTTPEHPFATPRSGWIRAGRLVPGDWVKSERFGAVRLVSVRSEPAARPIPVFNLSVAGSHAYFVGTDRVLVHNTDCQPNTPESSEQAIERLTRERDELSARIETLRLTAPTSPEIAALEAKRRQVNISLKTARQRHQREQETQGVTREELSRQQYEAENATLRESLVNTEKELEELARQQPTSGAEKAALLARKAELEKEIASLRLGYERTNQILTWLRELTELQNRAPETDAGRRALEEKTNELRTKLDRERKRAREWSRWRLMGEAARERKRERGSDRRRDEGVRERKRERERGYDEKRRNDPEWRKVRAEYDQIRRKRRRLTDEQGQIRSAREKLLAQGRDTSKLDEKLEQVALDLRALEGQHAKLRGKELKPALDALEPTRADLLEAVLDEADDVDEVLSEREELMRQNPSPERAALLQSSYERLQQELRQGRAALDVALSALINEMAHIQTTRASSSSGLTWEERLVALRAEHDDLRARWQIGLEGRLESARRHLDFLQRIAFRNAADLAELRREVDLLERELQGS